MSLLWESSKKDQKDSVFSVARISPRAEVGPSKEKSSALDFVTSLDSKASDTSSSTRQADEKKKLPTFKSDKKWDSKKPALNIDTKTDKKSPGMESETKPISGSTSSRSEPENRVSFRFDKEPSKPTSAHESKKLSSFTPEKRTETSSSGGFRIGLLDEKAPSREPAGGLDRFKKAMNIWSTLSPSQSVASTDVSDQSRMLDERPTSLASSRSEPENRFSFRFDKEPSKPTSARESKKLSSFAPEERAETSGSGGFHTGLLDEKAPSRGPAGGLNRSKKLETTVDTWSTTTPSQSVTSLGESDQKVMEDEERFFKWVQAFEQLDTRQSEVLNFQSKLWREQVHALAADTIQMRDDITYLYQKFDSEAKDRTDSIEILKLALTDMEDHMIEERRNFQNTVAEVIETEIAEMCTKVAAEEKVRKSEFSALEKEVQRLRHELGEPTGTTKELLVTIATRLQDAENSIEELNLRIGTDAKSRANSDSQQSLEEKIAKLQKMLSDAASKSELAEVKKDLERETKQRTNGQQTFEEQFLAKAEFKSAWKVEMEREGRNLAKADDISCLRAELKERLTTMAKTLS